MWGACAFLADLSLTYSQGDSGALFMVLTCEWELCLRSPSWPLLQDPQPRVIGGLRLLVWACDEPGGGRVSARWRSQGGPPLTGSTCMWGSQGLGGTSGL